MYRYMYFNVRFTLQKSTWAGQETESREGVKVEGPLLLLLPLASRSGYARDLHLKQLKLCINMFI